MGRQWSRAARYLMPVAARAPPYVPPRLPTLLGHAAEVTSRRSAAVAATSPYFGTPSPVQLETLRLRLAGVVARVGRWPSLPCSRYLPGRGWSGRLAKSVRLVHLPGGTTVLRLAGVAPCRQAASLLCSRGLLRLVLRYASACRRQLILGTLLARVAGGALCANRQRSLLGSRCLLGRVHRCASACRRQLC